MKRKAKTVEQLEAVVAKLVKHRSELLYATSVNSSLYCTVGDYGAAARCRDQWSAITSCHFFEISIGTLIEFAKLTGTPQFLPDITGVNFGDIVFSE